MNTHGENVRSLPQDDSRPRERFKTFNLLTLPKPKKLNPTTRREHNYIDTYVRNHGDIESGGGSCGCVASTARPDECRDARVQLMNDRPQCVQFLTLRIIPNKRHVMAGQKVRISIDIIDCDTNGGGVVFTAMEVVPQFVGVFEWD